MRVITVTRKPIKGSTTSNVREYQTGALNIDACRLAYTSEADQEAAKPGGRATGKSGSLAGKTQQPDRDRKDFVADNTKGRWPANLVLVHRPACHIVGERKVATGTAHRERSGGRTIFSETDKKPLPNMSYADADGMETVPAWACASDCPVRSLDGQSGQLTSGTGAVKRASSKDQAGNRSATYGAESRPAGTVIPTYGDTGGASRFFKQFGGDQSD